MEATINVPLTRERLRLQVVRVEGKEVTTEWMEATTE
jgi:hypothetical protein